MFVFFPGRLVIFVFPLGFWKVCFCLLIGSSTFLPRVFGVSLCKENHHFVLLQGFPSVFDAVLGLVSRFGDRLRIKSQSMTLLLS